MAIEITKRFVVKAPPAAVWGFLTDPQRVAHCMPVATSYKGKVVFERLDEGTRTAEIVATGQDIRGRGGADLRLTSSIKEVSPGETEVTAASKVNITGILAQMGRGMVQDVSDHLFQVFSQCMRAELETAAAAPAPTPAAAAPAPSAAGVRGALPEALDLGSLGAKVAGLAAGRAIRRPAFWLAVAAAAALLYLIFR